MSDNDPDFVISRCFAAPRDMVWRAWTDAEQLKRWFGPKGCSIFSSTIDLRVGGTYLYGIRMPDGGDLWGRWVFREITPPDRLVFVVSFSNEQGGVTRHPWHSNWPLKILSTITFEERGSQTLVTVRWTPTEAAADEIRTFEEGRESMREGWTGTLDKLTGHFSEAGSETV